MEGLLFAGKGARFAPPKELLLGAPETANPEQRVEPLRVLRLSSKKGVDFLCERVKLSSGKKAVQWIPVRKTTDKETGILVPKCDYFG